MNQTKLQTERMIKAMQLSTQEHSGDHTAQVIQQEDMFITNYCQRCGCEYTADLAVAPRYCTMYCSETCAENTNEILFEEQV